MTGLLETVTGEVAVSVEVARLATVFTPEKYKRLPDTAAVDVEIALPKLALITLREAVSVSVPSIVVKLPPMAVKGAKNRASNMNFFIFYNY